MLRSRARSRTQRNANANKCRTYRARRADAYRVANAARMRIHRAKKRTAELLQDGEFVTAKTETKRLRSELAQASDLVQSLTEQLEHERARTAPKPADVLLEVRAAYVCVFLCSTTSTNVFLPFSVFPFVFR